MYEYQNKKLTETQKVVLALGLILPFGFAFIAVIAIIVTSTN